MVNKKEENCRFCLRMLRLVDECDYVLLEEIHREILDVLRINLNISKCTQAVICNDCSKNLLESFSFKTVCLYTEDKITPSISNQNSDKLDMSVLFCKMNNIQENITLRRKKICRFCMKIIEKLSFFSLKDIGTSNLRMLQKYMPEMDLEAVEDPIICEACFYCLKDYFNFANSCLDTAEKSLIFEGTESPNLENNDSSNKSDTIHDNVFEVGNKGTSVTTNEDNVIAKKKQNKTDCDSENERKKSNKKNKKQTLFKCKKCNFKTLWSSALHTHSLLHKDKADIRMYKCEYCPFETMYKQHIGPHKQRHEDVSFFVAAHKCEICDFRANTEKSLKIHMINHKKKQSNFLECNYCPFKTKHEGSLKQHIVNHKDVPLLKCPLCTFKTKHRRILNAHKLTHNKDKTFACGQCKFRTSQKAYLVLHIRRLHLHPMSGKSYSCDLCAFKTVNKVNLRKHQVIHRQPTRTFKCDKCIFVSRYKTCVARHTILVHGTSEIQQYKCDSCQFITKHKSSLTGHLLRKHGNENRQVYKCPTCDYTSHSMGTVRKHQLKHVDPSELETFECYDCGFRTIHKLVLKNHVVLHMNVFYKCDCCDYQTKHKRNLSGHYRLLHNKKFDHKNFLPVKS
ncbi:zinc finger protein 142-like [Anoplophora glabripennis]|uniref:zinc finger protein 142-like n=1 Tax=Anoplophora glabripennis TaxID=217634 RepID=UPI000873B413|nr:zinc finger protein 142-like [Anoplophora glabripennis]